MNVSAPSASALASCVHLLACAAVLCLTGPAAIAQAAGSDYTASMPSVEKVKAQIQGPDAIDTAARQVAVFEYLQVYIDRIKSARDYRGPYSPGEQRLRTDYAKAQYDVTQSFKASHTPAEVTRFNQLEGQYSVNNAETWIKQLEGQQAADTYRGAQASLSETYNRVQEQTQKQLDQFNGKSGSGSGSIAGDPVLDPMGIFAKAEADRIKDPELRRCLELGDSLDACQGVGAIQGMASILFPFAEKEDKNAPPPVAGLMLVGMYHSRTDLPEISIGAGEATIHKCGTLVEDAHAYSIRRVGGSLQIVISNEPDPIVLTLRPDGSLAGPGSVQVKGRIITGYNTTTSTVMVNGAPAAAQGYYCNGPCSTSTSVPVYGPSMQRCTISQLAPQPPPAPQEAPKLFGMEKMFGLDHPVAPIYGFRLIGQYASSNGMKLQFDDQTVIVECGQAHIRIPYTLESTANGFVAHVQNAGGAFLLALAPDNTLRGSGSTSVNGRLVTAIKDDDVSFTPHNESCNVGTFAPRAQRNIMLASNGPMPSLPASYSAPTPSPVAPVEPEAAIAPSSAPARSATAPSSSALEASLAGAGISAAPTGGRTQLRVLLSSNFAGPNPLASQAVFVSRKRMDQILRELGVPVPANATPAQAIKALQTLCHSPQGCTAIMQKLPSYYVTTTKLDTAGKATLSANAATGQYYFFAVIPSNGGTIMWDIPANLAAGDNTITFTQANSERVQ